MINFARSQVVANGDLRAVGHSISILSHFQVEGGCGNHLESISNISVSC